MNRKQKIVISITSIILSVLLILGLTYAFFVINLFNNKKEKTVSITSSYLSLVYEDGTNSIISSDTPIEVGKVIGTKDFTVTNNGNDIFEKYSVILEDLIIKYKDTYLNNDETTEFIYPEDLKLTITCSSNKNGKECKGYNGTLPTTNDILITNSIDPEETQSYILELKYEMSDHDQTVDMGKNIQAKINIIDNYESVDIEGYVENFENGDYIEINSEPKISVIKNDGKYKLVGIKPETHEFYIKDKNGNIKSQSTIKIQKGNENRVDSSNNIININNEVRNIIINVKNDYSLNIGIIPEIDNQFNNNTLAYKILENALNNQNGTSFQSIPPTKVAVEPSDITERVLSKTEDDYGASYYYRGNVKDNYLNYNGMCWRILRIQGDGSIRIILEDAHKECNKNGYTGNWSIGISNYGAETLSPDTPAYHTKANFLNPSYLKEQALKPLIEKWFEEKSFDTNDLKKDIWCLGNITDAYTISSPYTLLTSESTTINDLIANKTSFFHESLIRFGDELAEGTQTSTLKCKKNNYTYYESYASTISTDELIYAGGRFHLTHPDFYLFNNYQKNTGNIAFWTLTLVEYKTRAETVSIINNLGKIGGHSVHIPIASNGVEFHTRPMITLKKDIEISTNSGDGTINNPYEIM